MGNLKAAWETNDGPIPGENFTSNTKNYPWHRPPEIKDLDEGVDFFVKKVVADKKKANGLITLIEMGFPISTTVDIFLTQGISGGKWTPDFALLLAGPIARIIEMMAKGAGIKDYVRGWEDETKIPTATFFKLGMKKSDMPKSSIVEAKKQAMMAAKEVKDNTDQGLGGLGAMPLAEAEEEII